MDTKKVATLIADAIAQDVIERGLADGRKIRYARAEWERIARTVIENESASVAPAQAPSAGRLFTTHEVASFLQVDASTVAKWIDKDTLKAFRTPGGHRRVRESDLREFITHHDFPMPDELNPPAGIAGSISATKGT